MSPESASGNGNTGSASADTCAKCGARGPVAGHIVWNGPIRFKADDASQFRRGTPVRAHACQACGHIALSLEAE